MPQKPRWHKGSSQDRSRRGRDWSGFSAAENRTRDDEPLDLGGPFVDFRDALIPVQLPHHVILDESVAAVNLNRGVDGSMGRLRREELRDARFVRVPLPTIFQVRGAVGQQPGRVDFRRHVRELPLDRLEIRDLLSERLPFLRVLRGLLEGPLADAERLGCDSDPSSVERLHRDREAFVKVSQEVLLRNPTAIKPEGDRVARADSHLVLLLQHGEALGVGRDDECGNLVFLRARPRINDNNLGHGPVRRERLRAAQDPFVPLERRGGARRGRVGATPRLRERVGAHPFSPRDRFEEPPLLLLGPIVQERFADEAVAHRRDDAGACIPAGELLDRDRIADGVQPRAPVLLRDEDPEESELAHLLGPRVRELLTLVERAGLRDDLLLGEVADRLARNLLDFREPEVHASCRRASFRIKAPRPKLDVSRILRCRGAGEPRAVADDGRPRVFARMRMEAPTKRSASPASLKLQPPEEDEVLGLTKFLMDVYAGHMEQQYGIHTGPEEEWRGYVAGLFKGDSGQFMPDASHVALEGDRIVGAILITHWMGMPLVAELGVAKDRRGRGFGRALLQAAMGRLAGRDELRLALYVTVGNDAAIALYRSMAFVQVGGQSVTARLEG